jgi:peptidoglycan-associated lipoprotein
MKFSKILIGTLFSAFVISQGAEAQTKRTRKADDAYALVDFNKALELYKSAYKRAADKKEKQYISYRMALCAKSLGDYRKAENYFKRTVKMRYEDPIAILYLAQAQQALGKFDLAKENYEKYRQLVPGDKRADKGIEDNEFARANMADPTRYDVVNLKRINSRYQDFSPAYSKKDYTAFLFTTAREEVTGGRESDQTGQYYTDIFGTQLEKKKRGSSRRKKKKAKAPRWDKPVSLGALGKGDGKETINTKHDEGPISLTPKANVMYYSKSVHEKGTYEGRKIFMSKRKGGGWDEGILVDIPVQNPEQYDIIDFTHPAISPDGKRLYFIADLKGGFGGTDIYYSEYDKRKKKWTHPKNLGPKVNTPFLEAFPTVHVDGTLYFASMGHLGMGGYDMYKTTLDENGNFGDVKNLGYPINSTYDDFGIVFKGNTLEEGLLTSNRKGGRGHDDIYSFKLLDAFFDVQGQIMDLEEELPLKGVKVQLEASNGEVKEVMTDADGKFSFDRALFKKDQKYAITVDHKGYNGLVKEFNTENLTINDFEKTEEGYMYEIDLSSNLLKSDEVIVPIVLPHVEYDFGKASLRQSAEKDLDLLVNVLNAHPELKIKLRSHTDHIGSAERNLELSQQRAQACVDYLVSKGIDANRLKAEGKGKNEPYTLKKDLGNLKAGTVLTKEVVEKLKGNLNKQARQLNRRTDFSQLNDPEKEKEEERKRKEDAELGRY